MDENTTACAGKCGRRLDLGDSRPCAIMICRECKKIPDVFRRVRSEHSRHIEAHLAEGRKTNPFYPFADFSEAFDHA
jgi:hypothetical protein